METTVKRLIWLYIVLLIFEGSLRKWVLPSLANPLLIVRDPVVLAIYVAAFLSGRFPLNLFILAIAAMAGCSVLASFAAGQSNLLVTLYGLRIDYGHLPLIWVMAAVLTRRDVERLGCFLLLVALPMTAIMVLQFKSPMGAFINRGVGEDEGGQIYGALGRIRPPGFFSFITGPQFYYPLVAAFLFHEVGARRRLAWPVLIACGLAVLIALPVSISRTVMLGTAIVGGVFVVSLLFTGTGGASLLRVLVIGGAVAVGVSFLPIFREARATFMARWEVAAISTEGNAWGGIAGRMVGGFTEPWHWAATAPLFGRGIGVGSNVGARMLSGRIGFLLAENEWGKIFLELGPILGFVFIAFRVLLTIYLGWLALGALLRRRDSLPALLFSACAFPLLFGQWAPPTILGFAVISSGLLLASLNEDPPEEADALEIGTAEATEAATLSVRR